MSNFYAEAVKAAKAHFSSAHDQQIFLRQMKQEADFTDATSGAGAEGPAQIMPDTARGWGVKNVHDPREAYNAAARNMAKYLRQYGGDWAKALTAYNAGPAAVGGKLPAETVHYINTILGGSSAKAGKTVTDVARGKAGGGVSITPGKTTQDVAGAFTDALLHRGPVKGSLKHSLLKDVSYRLSTGQYDSTSAPTVKTTTDVAKAAASGASAAGSFSKGHSPLLELIHNTGSGPGYAVKNGKKVNGAQFYGAVWAGHQDHVHVAAGPKTVVELGKLAQRMGLHVGENSHFGGVNPVHAKDSYHYKDEAIDVSGDPHKMNQFAAHVEHLYGLGG